MSSGAILSVAGVNKRFGGVHALRGVDYELPRGAIGGLIGPNGAGKSSLFNAVTGVLRPDAGSVVFNGTAIEHQTLERAARAGIGRTFQTPRGFASMSVLENLTVVPKAHGEGLRGALFGRRSEQRELRDRAEDVLTALGLDHKRDRRYDELSGGELRLLEIGRHLMRDIELLLLDEPTAGVAPHMQERIASAVSGLAADGISVLIVEHNLRFVFGLAETVAVMVGGRVIFSGSPEEVRNHPEVVAAYLGERSAA
jgi:ABC-type branched-subunit amino acid transport system ATPase component